MYIKNYLIIIIHIYIILNISFLLIFYKKTIIVKLYYYINDCGKNNSKILY